ncbi:hypothetical protein, partial [Streptomyces niveiscabiei]|uniref:hypothetical protein n=1 Tax=Streptomyces niveiscabiei TaxID=164115 RepID=UPI0038F74255
VPLAKPRQVRIAEMANYVGLQLSWPEKGWTFPEGEGDKTVQVGLTPDQALKIADALRASAEKAQAAGAKAEKGESKKAS